MSKDKASCTWHKQEQTDDCQIVECPEYDTYKDFKRDPSGFYVLVKVDFEYLRIEVAVCNKDHKIVQIFRGRKSQDLYNSIFIHEKENNTSWFQDPTHAAYLGKELKKAEIALAMGNSGYFQE